MSPPILLLAGVTISQAVPLTIVLGVALLLFSISKSKAFSGPIPDEMKSQLEKEKLLFIEEAVPMTLHLRNFRAPGRYASSSRESARGSFAVSSKRVVGYGGRSHEVINVPFDHPKIAALKFSTRGDKALCIAFEASEFNPQQSGKVELRYRLANVPDAMATLKALI